MTLAAACALLLAAPALTRGAGQGRIIPEPQNSAAFLTYPGFQAAMDKLARLFPNRVHVVRVGRSFGGYPLYDVLVSDFSDRTPLASRVGLYFNGSIHGDERDGAEGFARVVEDLARARSPRIVDRLRHELLVFTFANPDGWVHGDVPDGLEHPPGLADAGTGRDRSLRPRRDLTRSPVQALRRSLHRKRWCTSARTT